MVSTNTSPRETSSLVYINQPVNPQTQSPLFGTIPPEIRNEIFYLALQEYDDPEHLYEKETYYTRPGSMGKKRVDTELLRTCRRVYEETRGVVMKGLEVQFYLGQRGRAPPEYINACKHVVMQHIYELTRNAKFTASQRAAITHIRITAGVNELHKSITSGNDPRCSIHLGNNRDAFAPSVVTLTIRYTDWWQWKSIAIIKLRIPKIDFPCSVSKVVMELETIEAKRNKLESDIRGLFEKPEECAYRRNDGKELRISEKVGVREWKWNGPMRFGDGQTFEHNLKADTIEYVVKVLTWEVV